MLIETTRGPIDESELARDVTEIDTPQLFGFQVTYKLKATGEVVLTGHDVKAWKFDPLTEVTTLIDGVHGISKLSDLDVTTGFVDNADEYTRWVEYRIKGTDTIVSRSVHATLKRPPAQASGEQGKV